MRTGVITVFLLIAIIFPAWVMGQSWERVWTEDFEANTLDEDNWEYQFGTGAAYGLNGWGNNELQYYTDREDNIYIEDDKLHIIARQENYEGMNYTSARIRSINKQDFRYGKMEARAKLPEGQGIWPAIWMMPTESVYGGWPESGEIDIMELVGHDPEVVHGTVHYGTQNPYDHQFKGGRYTLDEGKFSDDFHEFSIEWYPDQIDWYVDGNLFYRITPNHLGSYHWPFDEYFHFLLNVAVGGNWPGSPDHTTEFPQSMIVDYIHVYEDTELTSSEPEHELPEEAELQQNFPNPFNPETSIRFKLPESGQVSLKVYNMLGRQVDVLAEGRMEAGEHKVTFDAGNLSSGTYLYRLEAGGVKLSRHMTVIK